MKATCKRGAQRGRHSRNCRGEGERTVSGGPGLGAPARARWGSAAQRGRRGRQAGARRSGVHAPAEDGGGRGLGGRGSAHTGQHGLGGEDAGQVALALSPRGWESASGLLLPLSSLPCGWPKASVRAPQQRPHGGAGCVAGCHLVTKVEDCRVQILFSCCLLFCPI